MKKRSAFRLKDMATLFAGILVSGVLFAGASASPTGRTTRGDAEPTSTPHSEPTRTPTSKPEPTKTPKPTERPEPTRTPTPKPEPTRTPKPEPTRTPKPTEQPEPTRTPEPTKKPEPTKTPKPTEKPEPTKTPKPTEKPEPTRTPEPTRVPTATPVPTPPAGSIAFTEPNYSVNENAGVATISVRRVVINGQGVAGAVSVRYQTTTGGSATAGMDYQAVTGTLSWANGDSSVKKFTVPIVDDAVRESTETVILRLYDLVGDGTIAPTRQKATLSILDNETGDIDKTAPRVEIVSPKDNRHVANINSIRGVVHDEGGSRVASVVVLVKRVSDGKFWNGTEWVGTETALPTELNGSSWSRTSGNPPRSELPEGLIQITARATDGAGNVGRATVTVSVDATPPQVDILSPAGGSTLSALKRVAGTASDAEGAVTVVLYLRRSSDGKYWTGREWGNATRLPTQLQDSGEWSRTEWPPLDAGEYKLIALALDESGNTATDVVEFSIGAPSTRSGGAS